MESFQGGTIMISVEYGELKSIGNSAGTLGVEPKTGCIRSMVWNGKGVDIFKQLRQNIKGYIGGLRIYDEKARKWYTDYNSPFTVSNFRAGVKNISFNKYYKGSEFKLKVVFTAEKDCIDWSVEIEKNNKKVKDRSIRVYFIMPLIAGWDVWAPAYLGEFTFDGMASFEYMYSQIPYFGNKEIVVPILSHFNKTLDAGYSIIVPYDKKVPAAKFQFQNGERVFDWGTQEKKYIEDNPVLEVVNYYIGLIGARKLQTSCKIFLHEGDWRPGLGLTFEKYKNYFVPQAKDIYKKEGVFQCGGIKTADFIKEEKKLGLKYLEFHGHFPSYGYYFPKEESWKTIGVSERLYHQSKGKLSPEEVERETAVISKKEIERLTRDKAEYTVLSRKSIKKALIKLKKAGINCYYYTNFSDAFKPWVEKNFKSSLAKAENGEYVPSGWYMCHLVNADLKYPFGKYMLETAKKTLKEYPMLDGFFLDCWRHYDLDFAHNDGVTVVNNKPCYSTNFAFDGLNEKIHDLLVKKGMNNFANKPQTIRSMKDVDGQLLEGDGSISEEKFFYASIAKPMFCMWTSDAKSTDENLRRTVVSAGYPTTPHIDGSSGYSVAHWSDYKSRTPAGKKYLKKISALYQSYLPLYAQFKERVLCFEADPMRLSEGMRGKLYTVKDGYVAGMMSDGLSDEDSIKYKRIKYAYFKVKRGYDVGTVEIMYPGDKKPRKAKFMFNGAIIAVPLPGYKNCAVVKLKVTKKTGKTIKPMKFSEVVDSCGDPKTAFEEIKNK